MRVVPQKFYANDNTEWPTEEAALAHEAELIKIGMTQWQFSYLFRRDLKDEFKPTYKECDCCNGNKTIGGGFGDPDGPRDCPACWGSGTQLDKKPEFVDAPPIPEGLKTAMREAWDEWWVSYRKEYHGEDPGPL